MPAHPEATSICHVAGVACITVAPVDSISAASACGSDVVSRVATHTSAPAVSGPSSSSPEMSNDRVVTASRQSSASIPGRLRIDARKFDSARCPMHTPFGRPVEPEV